MRVVFHYSSVTSVVLLIFDFADVWLTSVVKIDNGNSCKVDNSNNYDNLHVYGAITRLYRYKGASQATK